MGCNGDFCELEPKTTIKPCPRCGEMPVYKVNTLTAWICCKVCGHCVTAENLREARREWSKGARLHGEH